MQIFFPTLDVELRRGGEIVERLTVTGAWSSRDVPGAFDYVVDHEGGSFMLRGRDPAHGDWALARDAIEGYVVLDGPDKAAGVRLSRETYGVDFLGSRAVPGDLAEWGRLLWREGLAVAWGPVTKAQDEIFVIYAGFDGRGQAVDAARRRWKSARAAQAPDDGAHNKKGDDVDDKEKEKRHFEELLQSDWRCVALMRRDRAVACLAANWRGYLAALVLAAAGGLLLARTAPGGLLDLPGPYTALWRFGVTVFIVAVTLGIRIVVTTADFDSGPVPLPYVEKWAAKAEGELLGQMRKLPVLRWRDIGALADSIEDRRCAQASLGQREAIDRHLRWEADRRPAGDVR
jgi:hypothetical protein